MKRVITSVGFVTAFVSLLVLGLVSRVQAEGQCSTASIKGAYAISCQGTFVGVGDVAVVGVVTADGKGKGSEVETISFGGDVHQGVPFDFTYTVNADCSGTHTAIGTGTPGSFLAGVTFYGDIVIDDNKKEFNYISTNQGAALTCIYRKQ